MTVLDMKLADNATPILIGRPSDLSPIAVTTSQQNPALNCCWLSRALAPKR
jgi:hypothetical protein